MIKFILVLLIPFVIILLFFVGILTILMRMFSGSSNSKNTTRTKTGKEIQFKDADFEEID